MTFYHNKNLDLTRKSAKKVISYFVSITAKTKPPTSTGKHAQGNFTVTFFRNPCPFSSYLYFVNVLLYQQFSCVFSAGFVSKVFILNPSVLKYKKLAKTIVFSIGLGYTSKGLVLNLQVIVKLGR